MKLDRDTYLYGEAVDVPVPSLVWNTSYIVPRRTKPSSYSSGAVAPRLTPIELKISIDRLILRFLQSEVGRTYHVDTMISGDIILFSGIYRKVNGVDLITTRSQNRSPKAQDIIDTPGRAVILRGLRNDNGRIFSIVIRIQILTNLFTISIIASPTMFEQGIMKIDTHRDFEELTIGFWRRFIFDIDRSLSLKEEEAFAGLFFDSRGIIISSDSVGVRVENGEDFDNLPNWGLPIIELLSPLVSPQDPNDCIAVYMQDRQVVNVASPFDAREPLRPGNRLIPTVFVICVHEGILRYHQQRWMRQIGHALRRAHLAATMRSATQLDIKLLRHSSDELSHVEHLMQSAQVQILRFEYDEIEFDDAQAACANVISQYNKILRGFFEQSIGGVGLFFRMEASLFYLEELERHIKALAITSVDGYKSAREEYRDVAIIRDFTARLTAKCERISVESKALEQRLNALLTRNAGMEITEIQRKGEFILVAILVPYYLISTISHISEKTREYNSELVPGIWSKFLYSWIWTSAVFFEIYRYMRLKSNFKRGNSAASRELLGLRVFLIYFLLTFLLFVAIIMRQ